MSSDDEKTTPIEPTEPETTAASDAVDDAPSTDASTEPTVESPAVESPTLPPTEPAPAPPVAAKRGIDGRTLGIAGAFAIGIVLVFMGGLAIGSHHDGRGGMHGDKAGFRGEQGRGSGPDGGGYGRQGMGPGGQGSEFEGRGGGPGGPGGRMHGGGPEGMGGREGGGPRGGGGLGVVEQASSSKLTIATLRGPDETLTVTLTDDTKVLTRGDAGPQDLEEATASDIDEGDIVMVHVDHDDDAGDANEDEDASKVEADAIIILRAAGE